MRNPVFSLLFFVGIIFAHDHWIECDSYFLSSDQKSTIRICSGHYYPESVLAIKSRLIFESSVIDPSGDRIPLSTESVGTHREGSIQYQQPGTHLIQVVIKRPQLNDPDYWMKAIITIGKESNKEVNYFLGNSLEIVPLKNLITINIGDILPLQAFYNGKPIRGTFAVSIDGKKNFFLTTNTTGLADMRIDREGKYMVTIHYQGKGCSLTFELNLNRNK